jgi:hypothetical protein
MAAIVFPTSPTTNQAYSANGTTWIWDGTTWNAFTPAPSVAWTAGTLDSGNASGSTGSTITTSTVAPGLPSSYGNTGAIIGSNGTQWVINPSTTNITSLGVGTTASGTVGEIRATNNVTAYYSSDRKLKENIQDVSNALEIVVSIGAKTFDWTDEYIKSAGGEDGYFVQKSDFGVIAQDVQAVFPQAVRVRRDGTLAVDYEKLATLSFAALGQLLKRVELLENK